MDLGWRNHEPFSSSLILLASRVLRTFFPAAEALELWGITCGKMGEGGRATTIAERGEPPTPLLSSPLLAAVTFILFTLSWQTEAARGK